MKATKWPFKSCASPKAFLAALRASIPYRFKVWKTVWWIDTHLDQLVFTIAASYVAVRGPFALGIGDVLSDDPYDRRNAKSLRVRRFAGHTPLPMSNGFGNGHDISNGTFRLDLKHLPVVQRAVAERTRLCDGLTAHMANDGQLRDLNMRYRTLQNAISTRTEQARQEYHAAHAKEEARIEAVLGDERT